MPGIEIIAHRGASFDAPENTLSAIKLAWEQYADAIELDLWLSKDGKLVVFHDTDTKRFDGKAHKISERTWDQLEQLDVGAWKAPEFAGERIPTLESIFATIPDGRRAVVELKSGPEIVPEFARVVRASGTYPRQVCVISFNLEALSRSKEALPKSEHYLLTAYQKDPTTQRFPELASLIQIAKDSAFTGLDLQFTWPIDAPFVSVIKQADLKLLIWTVDDPEVAQKLIDAGVDGITTNRPGFLRDRLQSRVAANG
jgi:glycerophosphoryl diester phosphodiesterase